MKGKIYLKKVKSSEEAFRHCCANDGENDCYFLNKRCSGRHTKICKSEHIVFVQIVKSEEDLKNVITKDKFDEFPKAIKPAMLYLRNNFAPNMKIIVDSNRAELISLEMFYISNENNENG
jgi:hypothetical protein